MVMAPVDVRHGSEPLVDCCCCCCAEKKTGSTSERAKLQRCVASATTSASSPRAPTQRWPSIGKQSTDCMGSALRVTPSAVSKARTRWRGEPNANKRNTWIPKAHIFCIHLKTKYRKPIQDTGNARASRASRASPVRRASACAGATARGKGSETPPLVALSARASK